MGFAKNNGEELINPERKLRIALSKKALITISEDMTIFNIHTPTAFINTVFSNYWKEAKASITLYLQQKEMELENILKSTSLDEATKRIVIDKFLLSEEETIKQEHHYSNISQLSSKLYYINKKNIDILQEFCDEQKHYAKPGIYVRYVIEEYCALPFIERERIIRKPVYELIEEACAKKKFLKVKINYPDYKDTFIVYPYKIVPDPLHIQSYLVCYSRKEDEDDKDKIVASFSMARLTMPYMYQSTFHLNKQEINHIESCITVHSPAYLVGKIERIKVRLSEKGKQFYLSRLNSRPEKIDELSTDDIYVFECSQLQIFNYFFSFAAEAEIISPPELRERFSTAYRQALLNYTVKKAPHD